ncbi:MAG: PSD1 and planctomycete cytochrome C domain-containing protein [Akkermansiaceae bacterium]|nr:PSD1 and planctomycete cytochrome C domain-containing protein [Akkermansiaceae bacterium]
MDKPTAPVLKPLSRSPLNQLRLIVMPKRLLLALTLAPTLCAEEQISYNKHIRPILSENCFSCHGQDPKTREGDVALHLAEFAYKEHKGTTPIVPGNTEDSEVIYRIFEEEDAMPPEDSNRSLTDKEKQLIKKWVEQGAKYEDHWSFVFPKKSPVPTDTHPVDHFIQKRLTEKELDSSPQADLPILARRASLALTGLQPTPTQLAELKKHGSYEEFVDSLLTTGAYAERMTLFWLDAGRYADTDGYQIDSPRSNWPWRDWVIDAFRKNMPFDQFTIEQIAGDMLPNPTDSQLLATAFNRNHRQNAEGGALAPEFYVENVIDRVETTSAVWLGLTTGCARCHDHKYDPISQKEFFQLFSYFNNIGERGTGKGAQAQPVKNFSSPVAKVPDALFAKLKSAATKITEAEKTLPPRLQKWIKSHDKNALKSDWLPVNLSSAKATKGKLEKLPDSAWLFKGSNVPKTTYQLRLPTGKRTLNGIRVEALSHPSLKGANKLSLATNGNFVLTEVKISSNGKPVKIAQTVATYSQPNYPAQNATDSNDLSGWGIDSHPNSSESLFLVFEKPLPANSGELSVDLHFKFNSAGHQIGSFRILATEAKNPVLKSGGIPANVLAEIAHPKDPKVLADYHRTVDPVLRDALANRAAIEKKIAAAQGGSVPVMIMQEKGGTPTPSYILNRGQYDDPIKENPLERGVISRLLPPGAKHPKDRLGFARWLVSPDNPITARVTINRMWQHLFSIGLVKTSEDFGLQGEIPSHPDLLDWLAVEFIDSGWDVKKMYRLLVTSDTFKQSSKSNSILNERDPENRLLARGPRYRMDGFAIRDMALHASGLLNPALGGAPVKAYQPDGLWQSVASNAGTRYTPATGSDLYRKSMYSYWKRAVAPPRQLIFDGSGREICNVRHNITNTPLQALALMNDVTFVESARHLAERMIKESPEAPLAFGYLLAKGHAPDAETLAILKRNRDHFMTHFKAAPDEAKKFLSIGQSKRDASIDPVIHAAHASTAHLILNLDEVISIE